MQLTWHLVVIVVAVLVGACLMQRSDKRAGMSPQQVQEADRNRMYAYAAFAVAAAVAVYYYMNVVQKSASMCGGGMHYANMCGGKHY